MAELRQAFMSLPPVTRFIMSAAGLTTVPPLLALVSPMTIIWWPAAIRYKFQLWRLITPFFYAGSGLPALFNFFFLFKTTKDLEDGVFKNRSVDLAWSLIVMNASILALSYPLKSVIFFRALLLALTHFWAQFSPEQPMNLYGFITIPAKFLSYALLAMDLLQGGPRAAMEGLTGIISAHAYHYLTEVHPRANPQAKRYLDTPAWFKKLWGAPIDPPRQERNLGGGVTGMAPRTRLGTGSTAAAPGTGGHAWGRGNRLG